MVKTGHWLYQGTNAALSPEDDGALHLEVQPSILLNWTLHQVQAGFGPVSLRAFLSNLGIQQDSFCCDFYPSFSASIYSINSKLAFLL